MGGFRPASAAAVWLLVLLLTRSTQAFTASTTASGPWTAAPWSAPWTAASGSEASRSAAPWTATPRSAAAAPWTAAPWTASGPLAASSSSSSSSSTSGGSLDSAWNAPWTAAPSSSPWNGPWSSSSSSTSSSTSRSSTSLAASPSGSGWNAPWTAASSASPWNGPWSTSRSSSSTRRSSTSSSGSSLSPGGPWTAAPWTSRQDTSLHMSSGGSDLSDAVDRLARQVEDLTVKAQGLTVTKNLQPSELGAVNNVVPTQAKAAPAKAAAAKTALPPIVAASLTPPTEEFIASAGTSWLEAEPYFDRSAIPINTYRPQAPLEGTLLETTPLVTPEAPGDVTHIKIKMDGKMPYYEGQSIGIIPPGVDAKGKPNKGRLYSIASTRYGDDGDGQTVSFCVRRALYKDPETGLEDPAKKGVCSNFLTDSPPGTPVQLTGPVGKVMLLPEDKPDADIIMVGTGTGIAPYRSFVRRLFDEDTPAARAFTGLAWLFLGVANTDSLLYHDDLMRTVRRFPFNFRYDTALSREQTNKQGGKLYIQDLMEEHADDIFDRLSGGAHIYFCGLKGMMPGITAMLQRVAESKGLDWDVRLKELKAAGQWHVEVY